jgi:fibronectin-binding autotransporter adhesin
MCWGRNNPRVVFAIVLSTLWALACPHPATADITTTGDVVPAYDGTDPWVLPSQLTVGSADASILVSGGSQVQASSTMIASGSDVAANVTVTGTGSVWDDSGTIHVGRNGSGTMTIENGARLVAYQVFVDFATASVGRLVVTGPGTTWEGRAIDPNLPSVFGPTGTVIGASEVGEIIVSNGARVTTNRLPTVVGWLGNGTASLTVTGPNSVWENAGYMAIGRLAASSLLLISDGGTVTSAESVAIGFDSGNGSATVTGPGSALLVGEPLLVGVYGRGELLVSDGGRVESVGGRISSGIAGQYSVATITGAGSAWLNSDVLNIGHAGRGRLVIEDGGRVTCERADVGWDTSETGIVEVRGAGSTLDMNWRLLLGGMGTGTMYIEDGGRVTSLEASLGGGVDGRRLSRRGRSGLSVEQRRLHVPVVGSLHTAHSQ